MAKTVIIDDESFEITDTELKAFSLRSYNIKEYLEDRVKELADGIMTYLIGKYTDHNPADLTYEQKLEIIDNLDLETGMA
jgi:hypothetical protein